MRMASVARVVAHCNGLMQKAAGLSGFNNYRGSSGHVRKYSAGCTVDQYLGDPIDPEMT
jgi:hypothetical protein